MVRVIWEMKLKPETSVNSLWNDSDCSSDGDKLNVNLFHVFSRRTRGILELTGGYRSRCQVFCLRGVFPTQLVHPGSDRSLRERENPFQIRRDIRSLV